MERMRPIARGDRGKEVVDIQMRLSGLGYSLGREGADGYFGQQSERAIKGFQQERLLAVDGVVGENTWTELVEAGHVEGDRLLYLRIPNMRGDDVHALQGRLSELGFDSGPEDGIFGALTENALTDFQRNAGLNMDGMVGEATLDHLQRFGKVRSEARELKIPDRMNGYVVRSTLKGLRISLDAAHGGVDAGGNREGGGGAEKEDNLRLTLALAAMLEEEGADVLLVRENDEFLGLYDRVEMANSWRTEIHMCLHHNHHSSPIARGAATYYFSNGRYFAESGKRLGGYLVKALVEQLGRVDLHTHGRNYSCLREIRGLSVMVEPAFITGEKEGLKLLSEEHIKEEARALLTGLRWYVERR